ncbi:LuxR C-terminal-related transcriptional regulator [Kitasatospora sp. NPDC018058]|uniref:LuxR C-terminal-related transcriptional regulator n=1 Tax=Kitasatospora sp. NPDC018058 TaxID=3364025 RepID=UPI0037C06E38
MNEGEAMLLVAAPDTAASQRTIRVVLAGDDDLAREGTRSLLGREPELSVVGHAANGPATVSVVRDTQPDVLVLDLRMGKGRGQHVLRRVVEEVPAEQLPRFVVTEVSADRVLADIVRLGAHGCLHTGCSAADLVHAVRTVAADQAFLTPSLTRDLFHRFQLLPTTATGERPHQLEPLSDREVEVLRLIASGCSNRQIGTRLQVSETTVKTHVSKVLAKLGLSARVQAARLAWQVGLVPVDQAVPA